MTARWRLVLACVAIVASGNPARAACGDSAGDAAAVLAARTAVESACPCAAAVSRRDYVRCAADVLGPLAGAGTLPVECARAVRRCVRGSTCGRPGAVTCCRTKAAGATRCQVRRSAEACTAPPGGQACAGAFASCCDACAAAGCVSTTTTSTSTTTTTLGPCSGGPFSCGGACDPGLTCAPIGDFEPYCGCVPDGSQPCELAPFPYCNGFCGDGGVCGPSSIAPGSACICVPAGSTPCGYADAPSCGGACTGTNECQGFRIGSFELCACTVPGPCGCGQLGTCPGDEVCMIDGLCGCLP